MFIFVYFFTQTDSTRTVQRSAFCRSRRDLSNEYLVLFSIYLQNLASMQPKTIPDKFKVQVGLAGARWAR